MAQVDRVAEACQKLLRMFEDGTIPPAVARTVIQSQGDRPSDKWSLANRLIMLVAGTTDARGFRQWEAVGRKVKKGARAIYILGPMYKTRLVKVKEIVDGEEVEVEKEEVVLVGFKAIPVFRYEDTEGEPIPEVDYTPKELPPLIEVANKFGIKVNYGPYVGRFYGYYRPGENSIMLCSQDVEVFFHELAHAVYSRIRPLKPGQDPEQEIVAETVAGVLCELYGFTGYAWHVYEYIRAYAEDKDSKGVVKAILGVLADVERVLGIILQEESQDQKTVA